MALLLSVYLTKEAGTFPLLNRLYLEKPRDFLSGEIAELARTQVRFVKYLSLLVTIMCSAQQNG